MNRKTLLLSPAEIVGAPPTGDVDLSKRNFLKTGGTVALGSVVFGSAFTEPGCDGVSKDKAVRYTGLIIDLMKDTAPLFRLLGADSIAQMVVDKAVPALEKLKDALEKSQVPAGGFLSTVKGVLGEISNALFQLAESARRDAIIGIIAVVTTFLHTVELFVESEAPATADAGPRRAPAPYKPSAAALSVRKALEATRF